jgi:2-hydroxy-3-keto-5-methylthiopentenyl-1-phosphate phosphatase
MNRDMETISKKLIQCDFDGTVTEEDVSNMLLDEFANGDWRALDKQYTEGKLTVGQFNEQIFRMITVSEATMLDYIKLRVRIRKGFRNFTELCIEKGYRLVIVSNGLEFYIEKILKDNGMPDIEFHAAKTEFHPRGLKVKFIGVNGEVVDDEFKAKYVEWFLDKGYEVVYIGDGNSDLSPARRCQYVFAIDNLSKNCQRTGVKYTPFKDFTDITKIMKTW